MIKCVKSSYYIDNLLIIYILSKEIPFVNVIREEHMTFLTVCLVTSSCLVPALFQRIVIRKHQLDRAFCIRWPGNMQFKGCIIDRYIIK